MTGKQSPATAGLLFFSEIYSGYHDHMGLEGVELVMDCEYEFGVTLGDDETGKCETAGELFDLIIASQGDAEANHSVPPCRAAAMYRLLRDSLADRGIDHSTIRPSRTLAEIFPTKHKVRRASWVLKTHLTTKMTRYTLDWRLIVMLLVPTGAAVALLARFVQLGAGFVIGVGLTLTIAAVVYALLAEIKLRDPSMTLRRAMQPALDALEASETEARYTAAWVRLRVLIAENAPVVLGYSGVSASDITSGTRFRDLGF